jgi:hypothetical protein
MELRLPVEWLRGGFGSYDRQTEFVECPCLEPVMAADANGATVPNDAVAESIDTDGESVTGLAVEDCFTADVPAVESSGVVNPAGPWAEEVVAGFFDNLTVVGYIGHSARSLDRGFDWGTSAEDEQATDPNRPGDDAGSDPDQLNRFCKPYSRGPNSDAGTHSDGG